MSQRPADASAVSEQVRDQAIDWFVRLASGQISAAERDALAQWRAANDEHERAWQRVVRLEQPLTSASNVSDQMAQAMLESIEQRREGRRRALKLLGMLGVSVGVGSAGAISVWRDQPVWRHPFADLRTGAGEQRTVTLEDGSRLLMNAHSTVDLRFDDQQRRVVLREGEIEITTAVDALSRVFTVVSTHGTLQPLGTRFAVRQRAEERWTELTVSAGQVRIHCGTVGESAVVDAGQQTHFDHQRIAPPHVLSPASLAWTRGMLAAERMPLAAFLTELSRHRPGVLRCDPEVAQLEITGAFPLDDTDRVLRVLEQTLPVQVRSRSRYWVMVGPG